MMEVSDKKKLGDLIVELGLMDTRDLSQALSIAKQTSLPLGRVLIISDMVTEEVLQASLRCQSLLTQNMVDIALARRAMALVKAENVSLDDALFKLGWNPGSTKETTPLGELLVEAGYVTREQLQQALDKNSSTGLPFGRLLVLSGALTEGLLTGALNAQILIRDGKISKPQAAEALKEAKQRQVSVEVQLKEKGFYDLPSRGSPRIGELLLFCGVISQSDLVGALELGLMNRVPVGQVLTETNKVSRKILDAALTVQSLMAEQKMNITDARAVIGAVRDGASLEEAMGGTQAQEVEAGPGEEEKVYLSLFDFLKNLGRTDDNQVNEALQAAKHNSDVLKQVLLISGSLDAETLERADKCRKLVQDKRLTMEHANIAFDYAERFNVGVSQALKELQWNIPEDDMCDDIVVTRVQTAAKQKEDSSQVRLPVAGGVKAAAEVVVSSQGGSAPAVDPRVAATTEWEGLYHQVAQLTRAGKLDKALEIGIRLVQLAQEWFPERLIYCLDSVAALYAQRGNLDEAEQYYASALEVRKKSPDPQGHLLAEGLSNLGKVTYFKKNFPAAEDYARKFIEVVAASKGNEHPDVACGWQNLANVYSAQEKYLEAQQAYGTGIQICRKGLGENHPATVQMMRSYDVVVQAIASKANPFSASASSASRGFLDGNWRTLPKDASESS
jgi:tetratricopeptide (TPR) repeat protein